MRLQLILLKGNNYPFGSKWSIKRQSIYRWRERAHTSRGLLCAAWPGSIRGLNVLGWTPLPCRYVGREITSFADGLSQPIDSQPAVVPCTPAPDKHLCLPSTDAPSSPSTSAYTAVTPAQPNVPPSPWHLLQRGGQASLAAMQQSPGRKGLNDTIRLFTENRFCSALPAILFISNCRL